MKHGNIEQYCDIHYADVSIEYRRKIAQAMYRAGEQEHDQDLC